MREKFLRSVFISVILILTFSSFSFGSYYTEHNGTETDPYIILSLSSFVEFRNRINGTLGVTDSEGSYYKLNSDLDITGYTNWEPIGTLSKPFTGHFDGNGHVININITERTQKPSSLFGIIKTSDGYSVKNLTVKGDIYGIEFSSGIALKLYNASIENCAFNGSIGILKNKIHDKNFVGGIVGLLSNATVKNCNSSLSVKDSDSVYVGGIVGKIEGSYNIVNNIYSGVNYGIGYDSYGKSTDEGCINLDKLSVSITSTTLKNGTLGLEYNETLTAEINGASFPLTWSYEGSLPKGLSLDSETGNITGIPLESGEFVFTVTAEFNNDGISRKDSRKFSIKILSSSMTTNFKDSGVVKKSYKGTATVNGGISPFTWKISSGTIPNGLKLYPTDEGRKVTLKGKPKKAKKFNFELTVEDSNGVKISENFTITITKPEISGTFVDGVVAKSYSRTFKIAGGTSPYSWEISNGTLPNGLSLYPNTSGTKLSIKGSPEKSGKFTFTLKASDKNGAEASKTFTVKITAPKISGNLNDGIIKVKYSQSLTVSGGTQPYSWEKSSGTLPSGLKLSPNSKGTKLTIKGTPKKIGKFTFKLKAADKNGAEVKKKFTVVIDQAEEDDDENEKSKSTFIKFFPSISLNVLSEDILERGIERDNDLIKVKAEKPLRFLIGEGLGNDAEIFVDDKAVKDIEISEENSFTIPSEFVIDDFKVQVKSSKSETEELYITAVN